MPNYFVYRHIRHDLNVPFYIGIGKVPNKPYFEKVSAEYKRAFSKNHRNRLWNFIVNKTSYDTEILWESENRDEVIKKEIEFVNLYGRIDKKNGTLTNFTSGGEGNFDPNNDSINSAVKKNRDNGCFEKNGKELIKWLKENGHPCKGKERPIGYSLHKPTFAYNNSDGTFYKEFYSRKEAAKDIGLYSVSAIQNSIKKNIPAKKYLFFNKYMGGKVERAKCHNTKKVYKRDYLTGELKETFISLKESSESINSSITNMVSVIKSGREHKGFVWSYEKDLVFTPKNKTPYKNPIGIQKKECSKCGAEKKNIKSTYCNSCNAERSRLYKLRKKNEHK